LASEHDLLALASKSCSEAKAACFDLQRVRRQIWRAEWYGCVDLWLTNR
jgi:hypothetical protein